MRLETGDKDVVLAGAGLFDEPPTASWTEKFLSSQGHHLLVAFGEDRTPIGFVSGVETTHPDKGTEMFLYELSVDPDHRKRGVGTALVEALADLSQRNGCYGMWVATETDNVAALATYRAAGAAIPEAFVMLDWTFGPS